MVRNYKRKTEDKWTKEGLLDALFSIKEAKMGINECSKTFGISRATLYRHYQKFILYGSKDYLEQLRTCGGNPILSKVEELVMEKTIMDLRNQGFTVTSSDIKRICYEYCDTNGIPNQFREEKRMASDDWYYGFVRRHPILGLTKVKSKTLSDEQSNGVKEEEGKEDSQDAHKNVESLKKELDEGEDVCPGAPVLKKPLKRLFKTETQRQRGKRARRPPQTVRRRHQVVRNEKLTRDDGGDQSYLAKTLGDDDDFDVDSEAMETIVEEDDVKAEEHEESDEDEVEDDDRSDENGESDESEEDDDIEQDVCSEKEKVECTEMHIIEEEEERGNGFEDVKGDCAEVDIKEEYEEDSDEESTEEDEEESDGDLDDGTESEDVYEDTDDADEEEEEDL